MNSEITKIKLDGILYEIVDQQSRNSITILNNEKINSEQLNESIESLRSQLLGTATDELDHNTILGLKNALNKLSNELTGADQQTLDVLQQIKNELENPDSESGLSSFLDKITVLLSGFELDSSSEKFKTVQRYVDDSVSYLKEIVYDSIDNLNTDLGNLTSVVKTKASQDDLNTLNSTKADKTDLDNLTSVVETKASQDDLNTLNSTKADKTDLNNLTSVVETKASQDDLNTLNSTKADKTDLDNLASVVETKASQTDLTTLQEQVNRNEGTSADTTETNSLVGLRKALNALSESLTGADTSTLATIEEIKKELTNPSQEGGLNSFLDKVTEVIAGFQWTDPTATDYTGTIKAYVDNLRYLLDTKIDTRIEDESINRQSDTNTLRHDLDDLTNEVHNEYQTKLERHTATYISNISYDEETSTLNITTNTVNYYGDHEEPED